jgi:hypothetical protein
MQLIDMKKKIIVMKTFNVTSQENDLVFLKLFFHSFR